MILIPHDTIPQHYTVNPSYILQTSDMEEVYFRWSRMVHNNYIQDKGFLTNNPSKRIRLYGYKRDHDNTWMTEVDPKTSQDEITLELLELLDQTKATLFHYSPEGYIRDIIINVDVNVLQELPEQYRSFYYDHA